MRQTDRRDSRARPLLDRVGAIACALVLLATTAPASARSDKTVGYTRTQVWPAAVRFLVIEERAKITEKDADAGYVMFELRDDGKIYRGSLEVVTIVRDGQDRARVVLQIEDRPSWVELAMLTRLERRLRAELGAPPPPPPARPRPPSKDEPRPSEPSPPPPEAPRPAEPKPDDRGPPISPTP